MNSAPPNANAAFMTCPSFCLLDDALRRSERATYRRSTAQYSREEIIEQFADLLDTARQAMIRIELMQSALVQFGKANAVIHRHDRIVPAVHDRNRTGGGRRCVLLEARHEERGRQQKHGASRRLCRNGSTHMTAQTRADEDWRLGQRST